MNFPKLTTLCVCLLASAAGFVSLAEHAGAADAAMEWQFSEENDQGNGSKTAHLIYAVPETDNVQVYGDCEAGDGKPSSFVFGADIGKLEKNKDVELRFSGGGFDHALKAKTHHPESEEDLSGVEVEIANDDPLWVAMDEKESLDYLVPGYKADTLDLTRGRDKIKQFVQTCRAYAAAPSGAQADAKGKDGDDAAEKEAFESAKELGTVEAWEAFLANYSSGFRADLARAYIKKLGSDAPAEAPAKTAKPVKTAPAKPVAKKVTGCGKGQIRIEGKCIAKRDAASFCGPGYRLKGDKCVQGYAAPKPQKQLPTWQLEAIAKGCKPGQGWNPQEGCHEND